VFRAVCRPVHGTGGEAERFGAGQYRGEKAQEQFMYAHK